MTLALVGTTARRATLMLWHREWNYATGSVARFIYTDELHGKADVIQVSLEDGEFRWRSQNFPRQGEKFMAYAVCENWFELGDALQGYWGEFEIESVGVSGPPHMAEIRAVSIPVSAPVRGEEKSRTWTERSVKVIAEEIAYDNGLSLVWLPTTEGKMFRVIQQRNESDFAFVTKLAEDSGFNLKVADKTLIVSADEILTQAAPAREEVQPREQTLSRYKLDTKSTDIYRACKVTWWDPQKKELITDTFEPDAGPDVGPVLQIETPVRSQAEALEQARASLANRNKNATSGTLTFAGDPRLRAGKVLVLGGFHEFNGRYLIEQATHTQDDRSGYTTTVRVRREGGR